MITIEWTQRAAGRDVGDTETVERTDFVNAIIAQGRAKVIVDHDAAEDLFKLLAEEAERFLEPESATEIVTSLSFPTDLIGAIALVEAGEADVRLDDDGAYVIDTK